LKVVPANPELTETDGRRQRSERSREQIVEAMISLVRAGDMNPSAAAIADEAGVGRRTVFHHFDDMDGLYREICARFEAEVMPAVLTPLTSQNWADRLVELVSKRAAIYEQILPVKVAANLRRHQSPFLMDAYRRFLTMEKAGLVAILPAEIVSDATLFSALEMVTGFQTWRRLRQDQHLTPQDAEETMQRVVARLIDGH
jgi:AcrR family transcriptional regulator